MLRGAQCRMDEAGFLGEASGAFADGDTLCLQGDTADDADWSSDMLESRAAWAFLRRRGRIFITTVSGSGAPFVSNTHVSDQIGRGSTEWFSCVVIVVISSNITDTARVVPKCLAVMNTLGAWPIVSRLDDTANLSSQSGYKTWAWLIDSPGTWPVPSLVNNTTSLSDQCGPNTLGSYELSRVKRALMNFPGSQSGSRYPVRGRFSPCVDILNYSGTANLSGQVDKGYWQVFSQSSVKMNGHQRQFRRLEWPLLLVRRHSSPLMINPSLLANLGSWTTHASVRVWALDDQMSVTRSV
ncbi:hypothetical protein AMATHDRAFT_49516 [Amanita thiersii Skay4041]|uniref:Uncharacterized protein n=1 Tax=Amanita thiersii Skay4041 TaxID=703135 RepID=A0A2A9NEH2_9AGAR|nr:hypothetical protein AMATHDRAFT_49516 [Amanita thiersii Skay4041]